MQISAKTCLMLLCQRLNNHYTTTDYSCCNTIEDTTSTTRWLSACACTAGESIRFLLLRLLAPDFLQAESHPEPCLQSLRRRISHVQTKGGYQYAN